MSVLSKEQMETLEKTEEAVKDIRAHRPVHFLQKDMSTSAYIHTLAVNRKALLELRDPESFSTKDKDLLEACNAVIEIPKIWSTMPAGPERNVLARQFNKAMKHLRPLAYKEATVVITTCGNAANKQLVKSFKPTVCYIDDAAQGTESDVLIPMVAFHTIKQWIILGNHQQLKAIIQSIVANEFSAQASLSLFERLCNNNIEVFQLSTQYRMTPDNLG